MKQLTRAIDNRREFLDWNTNTRVSTLVSDTVSNSQMLEVIRRAGDMVKDDHGNDRDNMKNDDDMNAHYDVVFEEKHTDIELEDMLESNLNCRQWFTGCHGMFVAWNHLITLFSLAKSILYL